MRRKLSRKAQSTLEYAILVLIVIVALLAMQTYMKRGVQGKLRESTDNIGEAYSPGYTTSAYDRSMNSSVNEKFTAGVQTNIIAFQKGGKTGSEFVPLYTDESWPK